MSTTDKPKGLKEMGLYSDPRGGSRKPVALEQLNLNHPPSYHKQYRIPKNIAHPPGGREAARARIAKYDTIFEYSREYSELDLPWNKP